MLVHFSKNFINGILVIGGLNIVLGIGSIATGSVTFMLIVVGFIILTIGLYLRTRPYVRIEDGVVHFNSFMDAMSRTYHFRSHDDISLEDNGLYIQQNDGAIRIPMSRAMIDAEDWAELEGRYRRG